MKQGDRVLYVGSIPATVVAVRKNGVVIAFWGCGLQEGQYMRRRVSKKVVAAAAQNGTLTQAHMQA